MPSYQMTVALALAVTNTVAFSLEESGAEDGSEELASRLQMVRSGKIDTSRGSTEAVQIVCLAGASGKKEFIPVLKDIAKTYAVADRHRVSFHALDAIAQLGEAPSFFFDYVRAHKAQPKLAYYAVWILARTPNDEVMKVLRPVREASDDPYIQNAVSLAESVREWIADYMKKKDVEARLSALLQETGGDWRLLGPDSSLVGHYAPLRVWCRSELLLLSKEQPAAAAKLLKKMEYKDGSGRDRSNDYQAYVARFLSDEARAAWKKLSEAL